MQFHRLILIVFFSCSCDFLALALTTSDDNNLLAAARMPMQHKYHTKIDDLIERTLANMKVGLVSKLLSVLSKVLEKLGRYDEGTMMGGFLSFAVRRKSNSG